MDIILFGDQAVEYQSSLTEVLLVKNRPLLSTFLERTQDILRQEISQLPTAYRKRIPNFSSLQELVERYFRGQHQDAAIESALMTITQFSYFISSYENQPHAFIKPDGTHIVGVCTGLLAATAVASCDSLSALIPLAVEVVRVSFRLGVRVSSNAYLLEETVLAQRPWSKIITGPDLGSIERAVENFNKTEVPSYLSQVYISSTAGTSTTISGPPSMLDRLFTDPDFPKYSSLRDLHIYGPYHALHLYVDSGDIIPENTAILFNTYSRVHKVCGSRAGESGTVLESFERCIMQILWDPICWQETIDECLSEVGKSPPTNCRLFPIGPTTLTNKIASSLKELENVNMVTVEGRASLTAEKQVPSPRDIPGCNIAIVGMSGRFPDAENLELFWKLLENGLDVHREIPPDRFDAKAHTDPSGRGRNKTHTPYGCFIEKPGLFDPRFFNMSPREAAQTDPMQRLAITTAYEAIESSGFVVNRTPSTMAHRVGTFYGQTSDDWREINASQDIDTYFITGGVRAFGPGRINYHFGFSGPSYSIDTACSSSFAAINLACTSLRAQECDTAFTGGMNVLTNPDIFSGLSKGQFLSKTGSCKTYDSDADGYCRGDGIVTLILKRVEDAIADNDPILGVIRGIATNHSAEAVSITHPHIGAQQFLFQKVVDDIGVDVRDIKYVEMHGTGTQAGDTIEIESVTSVFAPRERRRRRHDQPLYIGSAKANIGHGEAVSGACALVKVLLMFQKNIIPPHCGIKGKINPTFPQDLTERGVNIAFQPTKFSRPLGSTGKRLVFINNFSAAGGNTAMLVEDAPTRHLSGVSSRPAHIVVVSAKSLASFKKNISQLLSWASEVPDFSLESLAYTTTARRYHYNYRIAFVASDIRNLRLLLSNSAHASRAPVSSTVPNIGFAFTGQGSQYVGMGKALYETSPVFREQIENLCSLAQSQGFASTPILGLVDGSVEDIKSQSPVSIQLAITIIQIALARFWQSLGVVPSVVIGHSLGEYAALHIAGVLSASDTISIVGKRAQLLVSSCTSGTHGMLAVRCHSSRITDYIENHPVNIACINAPEEIVLAGLADVIDGLERSLTDEGIRCTKLKTGFAFHSPQVDPFLDSFSDAAKTAVFHTPKLPIISPLLCEVIRDRGVITPEYLASHARDTVNFLGSLQAALLDGVIDEKFVWVEVGPHPNCLNMIKAAVNTKQGIITAPSLARNENAWKTVSNSLASLYTAGVNIDWPEYFTGFEDAVEVLPLPTYSFDEKVYWLEYKNNWTLTKGEAATPDVQPIVVPKFSTTSVHRVVREEISGNSILVVGESDLNEPLLAKAISGHLVNGSPLCPSSIFADIAITLGDYAYKLLQPNTERDKIGFNVCNMEVHKPLLLDSKAKSQVLQVSMRLSLDYLAAQVHYTSKTDSNEFTENAQCTVKLEDKEQWLLENSRKAHLVSSRIESLKNSPGVHTIYRGMAYKLFSALVNYDAKYRGMEEVTLDSQNLEATARVVFQSSSQDGSFAMSPYSIDSVCHISGFIVNATDAVDSSTQVYISHGWESMRFARKLEADKTYRSYVKMAPVPGAGKVVSGDVYVFTNDELIAVVGGLKFQCVPRRYLDTLLGPKSSSTARTANTPSDRAQGSKPPPQPASKVGDFEPAIAESEELQTASDSEHLDTPPLGSSSVSSSVNTGDETPDNDESRIVAIIQSTIANEMGVGIEEISDTVDLSTMGMDSLMSLSILGILREETGLKLGPGFLSENSSMAEIKKSLGLEEPRGVPKSALAPPPAVKNLDIDNSNSAGAPLSSYPPAQSMLLQGNPRTAKRNLFLLPDGSGSATSYAVIPDLDSQTAVFGLNCPFMKTPELFTIGVQEVTRIYMAAIKKRQAHGPYLLGGWSAGGVLAFEMTRQLVSQGEAVSKLILIDSPNPIKLEALPPSFHQFCNRIGLLGDGVTSPPWLLPHFQATVRELTAYSMWLEHMEIDTTNFPTTTAIWARHGVVRAGSADRPEWDDREAMPNSMYWLCNDRTDMGPNGWEKLVGGRVRCASMEGNHFTMMRVPLIHEVGRLIREALDTD